MSGDSSISIHLISDTHLEPPMLSKEDEEAIIKNSEGELLILAGDIGDSYSEPYRRFLITTKNSYKHVILVPGNHEYYTDGKRDMIVVKEHLRRLCEELGIILLDNSEVVIKGVKFIGSTCWPLVPEEQFKVLKREGYGLVTRISDNSHRLDYSDFKRLHDRDVAFLKDAIDKNKEKKCVIITHYPPSLYMLDSAYEHSPHVALHYNRGLIEEVAKISGQAGVKLWCCGHCHNSKRYWTKSGSVLLAANCFEGGHYDKDFSVTV